MNNSIELVHKITENYKSYLDGYVFLTVLIAFNKVLIAVSIKS